MSVKLTEKEINALATKVQQSRAKEVEANNAAIAKKKIPEARKIIGTIESWPKTIIDEMLTYNWSKGRYTEERIARLLAKDSLQSNDIKGHEADVIVLAHSATSMSQLCKTLGI